MEQVSERADIELMADLRAGSSEAMARLYERHGRAAYSLAYIMLRDTASAEDVVQDSFLALWRKAEQFDAHQAALRTWLLTIVRNRSIDVLRAEKHQRKDVPLLEEIEEVAKVATTGGPAESEAERGLSRSIVSDAVAQLPYEQRRTIELIYFGGYTYEEAAALTKAPLGTVKSRLRAAFQKLRPLLASERGAP